MYVYIYMYICLFIWTILGGVKNYKNGIRHDMS